MRINRDALLKLARDTVEKRFAHDPDVVAVFLVGSLRPEHAMVEGPADVDLLVLHNGSIPRDREIVRFSPDYHLDIAYQDSSLFSQPRELRGDAWRGWAMWDPQLLYQRGRFFEYTQSVIRAGFDDPANVIKRSRFFAEPARLSWSEMQLDPGNASPLKVLEAAFNAANGLAALNGPPIPERSLLAVFPSRARDLEQDDMIQDLFACAAGSVGVETILHHISAWEAAFQAASQSPGDLRLHSARLSYYKSAIESQLSGDLPRAALWPMLHTWALAAETANFDEEQTRIWGGVCAEMGLDAAGLPARLQALDAFLDRLEEILEQVSVDNGL